jgi:hypothetical protein
MMDMLEDGVHDTRDYLVVAAGRGSIDQNPAKAAVMNFSMAAAAK